MEFCKENVRNELKFGDNVLLSIAIIRMIN